MDAAFIMEDLEVYCYSGHNYATRPVSFRWQGREYAVADIEQYWLEPGQRCFRLRTRDSNIFQLCYNEADNTWAIVNLSQA